MGGHGQGPRPLLRQLRDGHHVHVDAHRLPRRRRRRVQLARGRDAALRLRHGLLRLLLLRAALGGHNEPRDIPGTLRRLGLQLATLADLAMVAARISLSLSFSPSLTLTLSLSLLSLSRVRVVPCTIYVSSIRG